jgi:uncharacterized protein
VDWRLDGGPLEEALAHNSQASFAYPENANHVLKHEEVPREKLTPQLAVAHYNTSDAQLDVQAAGVLLDWLEGQAREGAA